MSGNVSLDFANTAEWHAGPQPEERLTSYAAVIEWARKHDILSESQAQRLLETAGAHPEDETAAMRRILALREAVYHVFSAASHHTQPSPADLETLNLELAEALPHLRLIDDGTSPTGEDRRGLSEFSWTWSGIEDHLTSVLWSVARSAAELLTSSRLAQVRECADETWGWRFLDQTKNASRRWCDMADCGNRAKARRHYHKVRKG